jgi:hypothetical protein
MRHHETHQPWVGPEFAGCSNIKTELSHSEFKHWQKYLLKEAPGREVLWRRACRLDGKLFILPRSVIGTMLAFYTR